jgi:hypothetical protein
MFGRVVEPTEEKKEKVFLTGFRVLTKIKLIRPMEVGGQIVVIPEVEEAETAEWGDLGDISGADAERQWMREDVVVLP